ncbi:MAG: hypothetical protein AAF602_10070, partial [Myxococcota bacterium]
RASARAVSGLITSWAEPLGMTRRMVEGRRIVDVSGASPTVHANLVDRLLVQGWTSVYERMRGLARIDRVGYAEAGAGTSQSMAAWLRSHGLGRVQELFDVLCNVHGHASMLELPALYALKLLDRVYLQAGLQRVLQAGEPDAMDFVEGYQELWERIDERYDLQTRCRTTIDAVHRGPWGVRVHGRGPAGPFDETFDKLVVACSLRGALDFLDVSPEERRLFTQFRHRESWVTLVRMEGAPRIATTVYPYAREASPGEPTAFTPPVPGDAGVFVFHAHGGPGIDEAVVQRNIERLMGRPGIDGAIQEFVHTQRWTGFPHVTNDAIRDGFYADLEALQGEFHTYYTGEALTFPLVELVAEYSRALVAERF